MVHCVGLRTFEWGMPLEARLGLDHVRLVDDLVCGGPAFGVELGA